jgi:hypothetical protein
VRARWNLVDDRLGLDVEELETLELPLADVTVDYVVLGEQRTLGAGVAGQCPSRILLT